MIRALLVTDPMRACTPWWHKVEEFEGRDRFEFKPGLNILWGPNGSGKSTILRAMARALHCEQGGTQVVTDTSKREMQAGGGKAMKNGIRFEGYSDGVLPEHDGSPVVFFDPSDAVGLFGGAFDDDFMDLGIMNAMNDVSAGQTTMMRSNDAMAPIFKGEMPPEVKWRVQKAEPQRPDPGWGRERWDVLRGIEETLEGTLHPTGIPTILLDEPDRSLDIPLQARFWLGLARAGTHGHVQIIAASHSVFALGLSGVNYIELVDDYLQRSTQVTRVNGLRLDLDKHSEE